MAGSPEGPGESSKGSLEKLAEDLIERLDSLVSETSQSIVLYNLQLESVIGGGKKSETDPDIVARRKFLDEFRQANLKASDASFNLDEEVTQEKLIVARKALAKLKEIADNALDIGFD